MKTHLTLSISFLLCCAVCANAQQPAAAKSEPNTLSKVEQAAGWKLLFDGKSTANWRGYKQKGFPEKGWTVEDGALKCGGGGDLIATDQYGDFELEVEWKVSPKANSGIIYRVSEKYDAPWMTGPEYQILDDKNSDFPPNEKAGSVFDLYAPPADKDKVVKPAGEWNQARIWIKDNLVKHFLNGMKVAEYRLDSDDWKQKIAASKFKAYEGFGMQPKGFICLQDHGDVVWFRSIKVRDLNAPLPNETKLYNGKDMTGWKAILPDKGKMEDVWSIQDGIIVCKGNPIGYIRTEKDYKNYVLKVEWRFNPVTKKAGNSGVLLRMQAPDKVWPRSVEAQLLSENAGDFWNIDEFAMKTDTKRLDGRNTKKTHGAERPLGEWNEYEIIVNKGDIILNVNGEELNRAWDVQEIPGKICLQSEGAEIHFRSARLSPLE